MPAEMHGQIIEAEHLARYAWAARMTAGKRVLDAACGEGYGAAMMAAGGASEVVGVDLDEATVAAAAASQSAGVRFEAGDLLALPFGEDEFDMVVCFEAIEHVADPERALEEIRRVLRPGGAVVLSTPNRDVYTPGNPFHLRELTPAELEEVLSGLFESVLLRRQHTWVASAILDDEGLRAADHDRIGGVEVRKAAGEEPGRETYTMAIAGDGPLPEPDSLVSLTADVDVRRWDRYLEEARLAFTEARAHHGAADRVNAELLRAELEEARRQLAESEAELARYAELEERMEGVDSVLEEHEKMVASRSWRLTRPLRELVTRLRRR